MLRDSPLRVGASTSLSSGELGPPLCLPGNNEGHLPSGVASLALPPPSPGQTLEACCGSRRL